MSPKKLAELIAAARKAGTNMAADWDKGNVGLDDWRMRALMNFERDVVQSTADDREAMPQWHAFLEAFDKEVDGDTISMNERRGKRFREAVSEAMEANDSLACIARKFDLYDMTTDDVQPKLVVDGMTAAVGKRLDLLFAMVNNQEEPSGEAGND